MESGNSQIFAGGLLSVYSKRRPHLANIFIVYRRTRVGINIDRGATGVEAVSQELRTSVAIKAPAEFVLCPGITCWHALKACYVIVVSGRLRVKISD